MSLVSVSYFFSPPLPPMYYIEHDDFVLYLMEDEVEKLDVDATANLLIRRDGFEIRFSSSIFFPKHTLVVLTYLLKYEDSYVSIFAEQVLQLLVPRVVVRTPWPIGSVGDKFKMHIKQDSISVSLL